MAADITMPQLTDTMTEGTVVKWVKQEGDKVKAGDIVAEIETDKATMEMEVADSGTLAVILIAAGNKAPVGAVLGVLASGAEKPEEVRKNAAARTVSPPSSAASPAPAAGPAPSKPAPASSAPASSAPASSAPASSAPPSGVAAPTKVPAVHKPAPHTGKVPAKTGQYDYDIIVIGGGPAGYAAAIRAGQLKQRVLCIEKENLGGTCLNWGCIPTKALLEDGAFIRKLRTKAGEHGVTFQNLQVDFAKLIARSRQIADRLQKGVGSLFAKYGVKHERATGQLVGPHRVRYSPTGDFKAGPGVKEASAEHVIIAVGARSTPLPGVAFDGKRVITSREAMTLPVQPKRLAIVGAGAIGCEFADFYNAIGTEVTLIEMLPNLLPNEDDDVSLLLKRKFESRGIKVYLRARTEKVETTPTGVRIALAAAPAPLGGQAHKPEPLPGAVEADLVLVAIGVSGAVEGLSAPEAKLELFKNRVKTDHAYATSVEHVWAVGDCVSIHWPEHMSMGGYRHPDLAHVAHHEAVNCVERLLGVSEHALDYKQIPGCTYTHPQVASMGYTEARARSAGYEIKVGKFPFSASGRALAAGEPDGFVKLIFDKKYGELLGVHMIGETVTDLLAELVVARKLEATEAEIIEAIHPHPTYSEAVMEAAGVADGRAIHL